MNRFLLVGALSLVGCGISSTNNATNSGATESAAADNCMNGSDDDGDGLVDCEDPGCSDASACGGPANSMTTAPADWLCDDALYNANDGCHCNCSTTVRDPDCDKDPNLNPLVGCTAPNAVCDANGVCQAAEDCNDATACEGRVCGVGTDGCTPCGPPCADPMVCVAGQCEMAMPNNTTNNSMPNNTTPNNSTNGQIRRFVMVRDTSPTEVCESMLSPGADIYGIGLEDGGPTIGWALEFDHEIGTHGGLNNFEAAEAVFDGQPAAEECSFEAVFNAQNMVSLGCGGRVVVAFTDANGEVIDLQPGQQVRVYEYDDTCDLLETNRDRYDFFLCADSAAATGIGEWSCTTLLGSGGGEQVGVIAF